MIDILSSLPSYMIGIYVKDFHHLLHIYILYKNDI